MTGTTPTSMIAVELISSSRSADAIGPCGSKTPACWHAASGAAALAAANRCNREIEGGDRMQLALSVRDSRALGDQARAALAGEIRPEPLALHAQAVPQLRQGEDLDPP